MACFGWKSPAAARKHISGLFKKGALEMEPGKSRGAHVRSPLLSRVPHIEELTSSGEPRKAIQMIPLPTQLHPGDPAFAFNVTDDRMLSAGLRKRDLAIAVRAGPAEGDELAVVAEGRVPRVMTVRGARGSRHKVIGTVKLVVRFFGPADI